MKRKQIIIGIIVILCAGLGIYALVKSHGAAAAADEDEATPSVVTVQVGSLKHMTLHNYVSGYGTIEAAPATAAEPAADAQLAATVAGVVTKINAIAGQQVKKGDVLVELNSGTTTFDYAEAEVERQKKLFAQQNTSLRNLQDAEAQLASLEIVAPLSGTVTLVNVKLGQAVDASTIVAEVMDLSRLAVSAQIPAADTSELKTGEEVQLLGSMPVATSLSFVSPAVDANDGTVLVRALLLAKSGLRPGQFVQLQIVTAVQTNCLAAPEESIVTDENDKSVVALVKGDEATQVSVKIGLREKGWVEVEGNGLKEGDLAVTVGAYGLPDKTKIQIVNSSDEAATNSSSAQ